MLSALRTPAGELGAPVKSQHGYYLVKVLERVFPDMGRRAAKRTLFPYATLFRSLDELLALGRRARLPVAPEAPARDLHEVEHRSEEHTSELQSPYEFVCRLLLEKKNRAPSRPSDCRVTRCCRRCGHQLASWAHR